MNPTRPQSLHGIVAAAGLVVGLSLCVLTISTCTKAFPGSISNKESTVGFNIHRRIF
jgi:hypothetical protein